MKPVIEGLREYYHRVPATKPEGAIAVLKRYGCEATVLQARREPWKDIYEVYEGEKLIWASMHPDCFESIAELYEEVYGQTD